MAKKAHFIGIAGTGMSATALLMRQSGWEISGSDEGFYPPVSDYLAKAGIAFSSGYSAQNIPRDADRIVIGKNAKLVPGSNAEVAAAMQRGDKVQSFPEVIGELAATSDNIVVAGSYGKSTTTALIAWCLTRAGKDPSYFIGGITAGLPAHGHLGKGGVFVLEGDEYPSSNWDSRPKFLHYKARSVLLTSAVHDHVNVYPTHKEYLAPFRALIAQLPREGLVVVGDEPAARSIAKGYAGRIVTYGKDENSSWYPARVSYGAPTVFDLMHGGQKVASLSTTLLGAHNVENIVGAAALLIEKNLLSPGDIAAGVATFGGVERRMQSLAPRSRVPVFEGFGSSYEKTRAAIEAMRLHFPSRRLIIFFEPHTFTWRNRQALPQYDTVFSGAAKIYIYEPAAQGAETHAQLTQEEIVSRVRAAAFDVTPIHSAAEALAQLRPELTENDAVLLLTSGDLGGLIKDIPALAERTFPK